MALIGNDELGDPFATSMWHVMRRVRGKIHTPGTPLRLYLIQEVVLPGVDQVLICTARGELQRVDLDGIVLQSYGTFDMSISLLGAYGPDEVLFRLSTGRVVWRLLNWRTGKVRGVMPVGQMTPGVDYMSDLISPWNLAMISQGPRPYAVAQSCSSGHSYIYLTEWPGRGYLYLHSQFTGGPALENSIYLCTVQEPPIQRTVLTRLLCKLPREDPSNWQAWLDGELLYLLSKRDAPLEPSLYNPTILWTVCLRWQPKYHKCYDKAKRDEIRTLYLLQRYGHLPVSVQLLPELSALVAS